MSEQTPEGLDALVGRVEALMRDSQLGGDHRRVTARKVCGLFYAEIERAETDADRHCENALRSAPNHELKSLERKK